MRWVGLSLTVCVLISVKEFPLLEYSWRRMQELNRSELSFMVLHVLSLCFSTQGRLFAFKNHSLLHQAGCQQLYSIKGNYKL